LTPVHAPLRASQPIVQEKEIEPAAYAFRASRRDAVAGYE
jgi:hypothetical protein